MCRLPVGDGLQEAPEKRLRKGSSVCLPAPAASVRADVLALDPVDEDGLQGAAQEVGVAVFAGDHGVGRYVSFLQGLERVRQLLFDLRDNARQRKTSGWQEGDIFMCTADTFTAFQCYKPRPVLSPTPRHVTTVS